MRRELDTVVGGNDFLWPSSCPLSACGGWGGNLSLNRGELEGEGVERSIETPADPPLGTTN